MNYLAQQPLPPEVMEKEIIRLQDEAIKSLVKILNKKTWLERIIDEILY